jgi:hypothetical protein
MMWMRVTNPQQAVGHPAYNIRIIESGYLIIIIFFIMGMVGCFDDWVNDLVYRSEPLTTEVLYGRYVANFGEGHLFYFDLLPDSLLISHCWTADGQTYVDSCKWWLSKGRYYYLNFCDCSFNMPGEFKYLEGYYMFYPYSPKVNKNLDTFHKCYLDTHNYMIQRQGVHFIVTFIEQKGLLFDKIPGTF